MSLKEGGGRSREQGRVVCRVVAVVVVVIGWFSVRDVGVRSVGCTLLAQLCKGRTSVCWLCCRLRKRMHGCMGVGQPTVCGWQQRFSCCSVSTCAAMSISMHHRSSRLPPGGRHNATWLAANHLMFVCSWVLLMISCCISRVLPHRNCLQKATRHPALTCAGWCITAQRRPC